MSFTKRKKGRTKEMNLFKLLTNLLVGWKRWRRLLDTECFLPCGGALHCSVWTETGVSWSHGDSISESDYLS